MPVDRNDTVRLSWAPPPHDTHNGIIQGYQVPSSMNQIMSVTTYWSCSNHLTNQLTLISAISESNTLWNHCRTNAKLISGIVIEWRTIYTVYDEDMVESSHTSDWIRPFGPLVLWWQYGVYDRLHVCLCVPGRCGVCSQTASRFLTGQ